MTETQREQVQSQQGVPTAHWSLTVDGLSLESICYLKVVFLSKSQAHARGEPFPPHVPRTSVPVWMAALLASFKSVHALKLGFLDFVIKTNHNKWVQSFQFQCNHIQHFAHLALPPLTSIIRSHHPGELLF